MGVESQKKETNEKIGELFFSYFYAKKNQRQMSSLCHDPQKKKYQLKFHTHSLSDKDLLLYFIYN